MNQTETHKKRTYQDLEQYHERMKSSIQKGSLKTVRDTVRQLREELRYVNKLLGEDGLTEGKKKFLRGKRKFLEKLLQFSKKRIALLNSITGQASNKKITQFFYEIAMEELDTATFQRILGKALNHIENKSYHLEKLMNEYFGKPKETQEDFGMGWEISPN